MTRLPAKIHEVIVSTRNSKGIMHHAPMGISEVNGYFQIKPFKPSTTYDNLMQHRQCVINYVDDVRIFAGALTGRRQWSTWACRQIEAEYLQAALSHSELEISHVDDNDPRACFHAQVVGEYSHAPFRGFNRAQSAVIEAAILVSRLGMLDENKIRDEIAYLTIAIEKTAGERELEAWQWLMQKVSDTGIRIP